MNNVAIGQEVAGTYKVKKVKNGIPTVIEIQGRLYQLQHPNQFKRSETK